MKPPPTRWQELGASPLKSGWRQSAIAERGRLPLDDIVRVTAARSDARVLWATRCMIRELQR